MLKNIGIRQSASKPETERSETIMETTKVEGIVRTIWRHIESFRNVMITLN